MTHGDPYNDPHDECRFDIQRLTDRNKVLQAAVDAVFDLIANSHGVAGLHLNGDVALWGELLPGGQFEEWLLPLAAIRAAQEGK